MFEILNYQKTYTLEEQFKRLQNLKYPKYTLNSNTHFNNLLLPFIEDLFFWEEKELWQNLEIREKLIKNRCKYLNKKEEELTQNDLLLGFKKSHIYKGYSSFSTTLIRAFINEYNIKSIYDPTAGWGHRLLGAWNIVYHYNDTNTKLSEKMREIINFYSKIKRPKEKILTNFDAASYVPTDKYDAVFTCPPYWNTEKYNHEGDSWIGFKSYDDWLIGWWRKVVKNAEKVAPIFVYIVNEKFAEDMNREIILNTNYKIIRSIILKKGKSHMGNLATEYLFIFKK